MDLDHNNQHLAEAEKPADRQDEQFPDKWIRALDFAIYACEKLDLKPTDDLEFVANVIHSVLVLG